MKGIKKVLLMTMGLMGLFLLSGCKNVQIFRQEEPDYAVEITDKEILQNTYYIKNGTRFSAVYLPNGNSSTMVKKLVQSRVLYFMGDESMVPIHYEGELVAYASATADLKAVTLERYEDIGYSLGIYGGKMEDDGFYHMSVKKNIVDGSDAYKVFSSVVSNEIRIISIGGVEIGSLVDENTGIICGLEEGGNYTVEFYSGTYFYRVAIDADVHFLRAFEVYNFDDAYISDTIHGYMCFNTPEELKSGYYNINGQGLFLYHNYRRGETVESENLNIPYYADKNEQIASYSKSYSLSVPNTTKDMVLTIAYGEITDAYDMETGIGAYVVAPDGTGYDMIVDSKTQTMSLSLSIAMAGDWVINVSPKSLEVYDIKVSSNEVYEETTCAEAEFTVEEETTFQMFYAEVTGDKKAEIYGSIIGPGGITYSLQRETHTGENNSQSQFMVYRLPYVNAGTYTVRIYYYQSQVSIGEIKMAPYDDENSEIIIID